MAKSTEPADRRRFLKGAAVSAAAGAEPRWLRRHPAWPRSRRRRHREEPHPHPLPPHCSPRPSRWLTHPPDLTVENPDSDFMVDVFKSLGFEYIAANPGSSFRGLHESTRRLRQETRTLNS